MDEHKPLLHPPPPGVLPPYQADPPRRAGQAGSAPPPWGGPPAGYAPQQGGYAPQPGPSSGYPPPGGYAGPTPAPSTTVVVKLGTCPNCRMGYMQEDFTVCGIILAIVFFPIGVLCCFLLRQKKCSNCGFSLE